MAAVLRLRVDGRVPVRVVEYHRVRAGQVQADAAAAGGGDEREIPRVAIEALAQSQAHVGLGEAVHAQVGDAMQAEELLQDVQHARHLGEDERAMSAGLQAVQQHRHLLQFAAIPLQQTRIREHHFGVGAQRPPQ
eukprot:ctg_145.g48